VPKVLWAECPRPPEGPIGRASVGEADPRLANDRVGREPRRQTVVLLLARDGGQVRPPPAAARVRAHRVVGFDPRIDAATATATADAACQRLPPRTGDRWSDSLSGWSTLPATAPPLGRGWAAPPPAGLLGGSTSRPSAPRRRRHLTGASRRARFLLHHHHHHLYRHVLEVPEEGGV
jgi:hypothetical protein